jgi:acetyl esterase
VPLNAQNLSDLPPTMIITAEYDVLRDDGSRYATKLESAGIKVIHRDYPGMIHGFFNYGKFIDEGIIVREYLAKEINRLLGS